MRQPKNVQATSKALLRQQIRKAKERYSHDERLRMSQSIVTHVLAIPEVATARVILAYASLPDEVDTRTLLEQLLAAGKTVLLPKVVDGEKMEVRQYTGNGDLQEGAFHIMEPIGAPYPTLSSIDVAIIPGMAFTHDGKRLGRGKGYYDRFLALLPRHTKKIAICFPFQLIENIPTEPHDFVMDKVVCN